MRQGLRTLTWRILLGCGACALIQPNVMASASYAKSKMNRNFTEVRLMTPFNAGGINPKLEITETVKGNCWATSSKDAARPNTWRCQANNTTYDPCFINSIRHSNSVLCLETPWANKAVKIELDSALPSNRSKVFSKKSAQPWALELANGNHCTLITGPSLTLAGLKTTYRCNKATIIGKVDSANKQWTALYAPDNGLYMEQTAITTAWY